MFPYHQGLSRDLICSLLIPAAFHSSKQVLSHQKFSLSYHSSNISQYCRQRNMSTQVSYTPTLPQSNAGCSGLLSMLTEPSPQLIHSALSKIYSLVSTHWHELSPHISLIEKLSEPWNESGIQLPQNTRNIAIAIASRVYYFLEDRTGRSRSGSPWSLLGTELLTSILSKKKLRIPTIIR